jgi:RES domain-containing protein
VRFQGLAYRAHNPFWSFDPLSGEGAKTHGGRFNPQGRPALYLALSPTLALVEYNQGFPHRPQPVTLCAYEVDCADILDLTEAHERDRLKITLETLANPWEMHLALKQTPPTWQLAERLIQAGDAGIIVPSYARNAPEQGKNLVLWQWSNLPPHQILLIDDDNRLPKNQDSWKSSPG